MADKIAKVWSSTQIKEVPEVKYIFTKRQKINIILKWYNNGTSKNNKYIEKFTRSTS